MWFARKHYEYGCPMCGRPPVFKEAETQPTFDLAETNQ